MPDEIRFDWNEANLNKVLASNRGITPELCEELKQNEPMFSAEARDGKTADYWMIAPDNNGRFWTIVVVHMGDELWRPISGWPRTRRQIQTYHGEDQT